MLAEVRERRNMPASVAGSNYIAVD